MERTQIGNFFNDLIMLSINECLAIKAERIEIVFMSFSRAMPDIRFVFTRIHFSGMTDGCVVRDAFSRRESRNS